MDAGVEFAGKFGSAETINEFELTEAPPFNNKLSDGYATSPKIKSFTPEPS